MQVRVQERQGHVPCESLGCGHSCVPGRGRGHTAALGSAAFSPSARLAPKPAYMACEALACLLAGAARLLPFPGSCPLCPGGVRLGPSAQHGPSPPPCPRTPAAPPWYHHLPSQSQPRDPRTVPTDRVPPTRPNSRRGHRERAGAGVRSLRPPVARGHLCRRGLHVKEMYALGSFVKSFPCTP